MDPESHVTPAPSSPSRDPHERRRRSLERYRPGPHPPHENANGNGNSRPDHGDDLQGEERFGSKPLPVEAGQREGDDRRGPRGGRGGGGWGRGGRRGENDLGRMMGEMRIGEGDLRHRLNQRSRDFQPPPQGHDYGRESHENEQDHPRASNGRDQHRRVQGRGVGSNNSNTNSRRPKRNTENFNPCHAPPDMRLLVAHPGLSKFNRRLTSRDVVMVSDLFGSPDDLSIYHKLLKELETVGSDVQLWQSWHGDSHMIADDKKRWKQDCPTFGMVVDRIRDYFDMDVKATRLNLYRDSKEWKPFHHDAAAVKADKAKTQNFTVAVSFGMEREAAFEHAKTKTVLALPQPNGTIYTFGKDVNVEWRHGILQMKPEEYSDKGRLSIIAWGWIDQDEDN